LNFAEHLPRLGKRKRNNSDSLFEGREAIYVEKGALRVRVSDLRGDVAQLYILAEVEEIPTAMPSLPRNPIVLQPVIH
jgi:hypothetical protein